MPHPSFSPVVILLLAPYHNPPLSHVVIDKSSRLGRNRNSPDGADIEELVFVVGEMSGE